MFNLKEFLRNNQYRLTLGEPEDMSDGFELVEDVIYPDLDQIQSMVYHRVDGCQMQTLLKRKNCGIYEYCYIFRIHENDENGDVADYQWYALEWRDAKEDNDGIIDVPNEAVFTITKKEFQEKYAEFYDPSGMGWFCTFIQPFMPDGFEIRSSEVCGQFVKAAPQCFTTDVFTCEKYPFIFITTGMKEEFWMANDTRMTLLNQIPDGYVFNFIGHIVE